MTSRGEAQTPREWVATRRPAPPGGLGDRLAELLSAPVTVDRCLTAAEGVLDRLLGEGNHSRESALDLLAADALVSYAFEMAADEPATLPLRAQMALRRIALLGSGDVP